MQIGLFKHATLYVQGNGWINILLFKTWFEERFLPYTASRRSPESPVVLILDNVVGHVHPSILRLAQQNVIMIGLPRHNMHVTHQPLDIGIMKPLKEHGCTYVPTRVPSWCTHIAHA